MSLSLARQTDQANIRTSEGSGTTTLTSADSKWQVFNLSAARTVALPSTGVKAGDSYIFENQGTGTLTVQSSALNTLGIVDSLQSRLICIAFQDVPTNIAHWKLNFIYSLQTYTSGVSYNGGNTPSVTGQAGFSLSKGVWFPYQMPEGTWRLRFNLLYSQTGNTTGDITVNGITFPSAQQAVALRDTGGTFNAATGQTGGGNSSMNLRFSTVAVSNAVSGDVELASKPTWAY